MSVPVYYGGQGGQPLRMAGLGKLKTRVQANENCCAEFYQTNVCHPGLKPCRRPDVHTDKQTYSSQYFTTLTGRNVDGFTERQKIQASREAGDALTTRPHVHTS